MDTAHAQQTLTIRRVSRAELETLNDEGIAQHIDFTHGGDEQPSYMPENAEAADYLLARIVARHTHSLRMAALHKAEAEVQAERASRFIRRYADLFAAVAEGKRNWTGMHSGVKMTATDRLPTLKLVDKQAALAVGLAKLGEPPITLDTAACRTALETPAGLPPCVTVTPQERLAYTLPGAKDGE